MAVTENELVSCFGSSCSETERQIFQETSNGSFTSNSGRWPHASQTRSAGQRGHSIVHGLGGANVPLWPAILSGHRQLPGIGIQWQQYGGELEGFDFWSVPISRRSRLWETDVQCSASASRGFMRVGCMPVLDCHTRFKPLPPSTSPEGNEDPGSHPQAPRRRSRFQMPPRTSQSGQRSAIHHLRARVEQYRLLRTART
jgi:hypothetical protein